jgi:signal transduction histidine kinase
VAGRGTAGPGALASSPAGSGGLASSPAGSGAIRIEFVDDGPGLPASVAELARRGRRRRGPHGHGLAVAASVASSHGGRLTGAPSERGARVMLELPLVVARRPVADSPPESGGGRGLAT